VIGWLYGKDYGDKLCKAVNCGYDTDCTGATLGSVLGIIHGERGIPEEWKGPVGDAIKPVKFTNAEGLPATVGELARRTSEVAEEFTSRRSDVTEFSDSTVLPDNATSLLFRNERVRGLVHFDVESAVFGIGDTQVVFHYGGPPVLRPGIERVFEVSFMRDWRAVTTEGIDARLEAPASWSMESDGADRGRYRFKVLASRVEDRNSLRLEVKEAEGVAEFEVVVLGPNAVRPIPASSSAPRE
jgi:hypothetical protein